MVTLAGFLIDVGSLSEPTMAEVDEALKPSLGLD